MNQDRRPLVRRRSPAGVTLPELILFTLLLGLLATLVGTAMTRRAQGPPPRAVEEEVRAFLNGAEEFAAERDRWPGSPAELASEGYWEPDDEVTICHFRAVPGTPYRAPYMLVRAAHADSRTVVFTAYPTWGGRLLSYEAGAAGCPET